MSADAIVWGLIVFCAVLAFSYFIKIADKSNADRVSEEAKLLSNTLLAIDTESSHVNFVLTDVSLVLSEHEKAVAALPGTTLIEPRAIRVNRGGSRGSSLRIAKGVSVRFGRHASVSQSIEQLKSVDQGILIVTNQRVVFLGALKTISLDVDKLISIDRHPDGIGLHCKGKEKVECFQISPAIKLTGSKDGRRVAVPFSGQVLERIITRTIRSHADQKAIAVT